VPRIESAAGAKEAIAHMSHPPHGDRGVASYNRGASWGLSENPFPAPRTASCLIQIETRGALDDCEEIAGLDGVDALFVGPLDLSFALGTPRDFSSAPFVEALTRVVDAAKVAGVPVGILAPDGNAAARFVDQGFSFVAIGSDSTLLAHAVAHNITAATAATSQKKEDNDVR
jgi:4-hydroxy-2-oxoheptanedioate aldolase